VKVMPSAVERLLYLTLLMIFIGVSMAIFVLYAQLQAQERVSREIKQAVNELKLDKTAKDKIILDHINCIALFLSQPNRPNVRIEDVENCKITEISNADGSVSSVVVDGGAPVNGSNNRPVAGQGQSTSGGPSVPASTPIPAPATPRPTPAPTPAPPPPPTNTIQQIINNIGKLLGVIR
jgi:hypothetical protein